MNRKAGREERGLGKIFRRLAADSKQRDDDELTDSCDKHGATKIKNCGDRTVVTVYGRIRNITMQPRQGTPNLEAELWDGSGAVTLVWLGRRALSGVHPGQQMRATGRICHVSGRRVVYNPRYELLPAEVSSD